MFCTKCRKNTAPEDFPSNGRKGRRRVCKTCWNAFMRPRSRAHYQANKPYYLERNKRHVQQVQAYIREVKEQPCTDCKRSYPYYVMDFDHVRGKRYNVSFIARFGSLEMARTEIAKCDLVCANCHRERTHQRQRARRESNPESVDVITVNAMPHHKRK